MQTSDILPPEIYKIVKVAAITGLFAAGAMIIGVAYKLYKFILGEEKAKKYRMYFLFGTLPLAFILVYIYFLLF